MKKVKAIIFDWGGTLIDEDSLISSPFEGGGRVGVKMKRVTHQMVVVSKKLRNNMAEAEKQLWYLLRERYLNGFKFRRQQPIGKYVADFVCFENKLVIEIDGGQHMESRIEDNKRDEWLRKEGYRVLRFWNNDILENREAVISKILEYCKR